MIRLFIARRWAVLSFVIVIAGLGVAERRLAPAAAQQPPADTRYHVDPFTERPAL